MGWPLFFMISIPVTAIVFTLWYFRITAIFSIYNSQVDSRFSSCPTSPPDITSALALVIPFPLCDFPSVLSHFSLWKLTQFSPIIGENKYKLRTDLLLYPANRTAEFESEFNDWKTKNSDLYKLALNYFNSIDILTSPLTFEQNTYQRDLLNGGWIASGSTEMFYPLVTNSTFAKKYAFVFYHEPDTWPIRPGWLSQLQNVVFGADSNFWFLGTQQRERRIPGGRIQPYMNGNLVVRIENQCCRSFLEEIHQEYRYLPFDSSMLRYLIQGQNRRLMQHIIPRMRYTDLIGDFGNTELTVEYLLTHFPNMYIVHGKGLTKDIQRILNEQTQK